MSDFSALVVKSMDFKLFAFSSHLRLEKVKATAGSKSFTLRWSISAIHMFLSCTDLQIIAEKNFFLMRFLQFSGPNVTFDQILDQ